METSCCGSKNRSTVWGVYIKYVWDVLYLLTCDPCAYYIEVLNRKWTGTTMCNYSSYLSQFPWWDSVALGMEEWSEHVMWHLSRYAALSWALGLSRKPSLEGLSVHIPKLYRLVPVLQHLNCLYQWDAKMCCVFFFVCNRAFTNNTLILRRW